MSSQEPRSPQTSPQSEPAGIVVTDSNLNPVIQIVTWLLLALVSLMLCFRLLTRFFLKAHRKPGPEDILIFGSYILCVGESACMLLPGGSIFGKSITDISSGELRTGVKIGYARDLLFILALGLAKWSVNACVQALSPDVNHRRINLAITVIIGLWIFSSFFATAFQCGSRGPWDSARSDCFDQRAFYQYVGITNIITDAALITLPVAIIWPLRMPWTSLATAVTFFMARILAIAATIAQLVYIPRLFVEDWTLRAWPYFLCIQFVQFASISAACIVYFLPFLRSLQSGLPWATATTFSTSYTLSKISKPTNDGRIQPSVEGHNSQNSGRRHYIKITTENQIVSRTRSQEGDPQPASNAELYAPNW